MDFRIRSVDQVNITVVYDELDLAELSRDRLRSLIPDARPRLIDMPMAITLAYPDLGLACIVDSRRIRCNDAGHSPVGDRPLAVMARSAADIAHGHGQQRAFGLNFDVSGEIVDAEDVFGYLTERFLNSPLELRDRLEATEIVIVPRLIFTIPPVRYTLTLNPDPDGDSLFKANLNAHHVTDELPDLDELQSLLVNQYDLFIEGILRKV